MTTVANVPRPDASSSRIAIVGAGSIGTAWAIVFARAKLVVTLHDPDRERLGTSLSEIDDRLADLAAFSLLAEPPAAVAARVSAMPDLEAAVAGADHVQECAPEDLDLKRALFSRVDAACAPDAILASSSSALTASAIAGHLAPASRRRCLVVHPGNPPYLLPVAELAPSPETDATAVARTRELIEHAGMIPVLVRREVEGFVFNRLQGAMLREAYCLVRDGVASVEDVDRIVREGLAPRWSVIGPFETADLNTRGGIEAHAERMGPAYARMGAERGQDDPWTPDLVARVSAERRALLPLDAWAERVAWRDRRLMALARARRDSERREG